MRVLGEHFIEQGILNQAKVDMALARQRDLAARSERKRLGEILLEMGLVTPQQLLSALDHQQQERT